MLEFPACYLKPQKFEQLRQEIDFEADVHSADGEMHYDHLMSQDSASELSIIKPLNLPSESGVVRAVTELEGFDSKHGIHRRQSAPALTLDLVNNRMSHAHSTEAQVDHTP